MSNPTRFLVLTLAFFLGLSAVFACGGDDDDDDNDDTADDDSGGDDTSDDDTADDDSGDDDTGDECDAGLLPGTWVAEFATLDIFDNGTFHIVGVNQAIYNVWGSYLVDGCVISFADLDGNGACPGDEIGAYDFAVTETTLTTTLSADECEGRVTGMDGTTFDRE